MTKVLEQFRSLVEDKEVWKEFWSGGRAERLSRRVTDTEFALVNLEPNAFCGE